MAPKPRGLLNRHGIENLYIKFDDRTKRYYAQYKDPRGPDPEKKRKLWHGLGAGKELNGPEMKRAKLEAKQLNAILAQEIKNHRIKTILDNRPKSSQLTMSGWLVEYRKILNERLASKEIAENTWKQGVNRANVIEKRFGSMPLRAIEVKQVADWIKTYKQAGKVSMAQSVRKWLVDVFVEAIQAGECEDNPAAQTAKPRAKIKKARLTLDAFKSILLAAEKHLDPWVANAMLLSLVTGQARQEVNRMQFGDVRDGYLHVIRKKTGAKIKIPVGLTLEAMDISVEGVIRRCRDDVVSRHLIHHTKGAGGAKRGDAIFLQTISEMFTKARKLSGLDWGDYSPPSFHEIRSLSGRLYKDQGIDTQSLWGHKHAQTSDGYHDARGHDWVVVKL